ncbi:MAG: hypothetical protein PHU93_04415 [Candidatus Gracilibacteria bacterium]|nr:hypothetical protein [Candidatus Gracilibacteria bacterium]
MALIENMAANDAVDSSSQDSSPKVMTAVQNKPKNGLMFTLSLVMVIGVASATAYLYWQNSKMDTKIAEIQMKTQEYQTKIELLKKDPIVRSGEIFFGQKENMSKAIDKSNAAVYIREMDKIEKDFGFYFNGFTFSQDKISTGVSAQKGLDTDAVQKLIKFIASYRTPPKPGMTGSGSPFELSPVLSVSGDEEKRNISVEFTVK